jgi:predicted dinucleotide-binding enzyme
VVSQALGGKLAEVGHDVRGTRDVARTMANREPNQYGLPAFSIWREQHPEVKVGTFADAAGHGEVVINATNSMGSLAALAQAGASNLDGKILMDISNPLDFSRGMPPTLSVCNTDSLGEQIQRVSARKVVKTLNTVTAGLDGQPAAARRRRSSRLRQRGRRGREDTGQRVVADVVRLDARPGPGRHHQRARRRDVPAALAAPVRRVRQPDGQRQGGERLNGKPARITADRTQERRLAWNSAHSRSAWR